MARHGQQQKLRQMLREEPEKIIAYLKTLSPSGTELEIMSLSTYDFKEEAEDENLVRFCVKLTGDLDGYILQFVESPHREQKRLRLLPGPPQLRFKGKFYPFFDLHRLTTTALWKTRN
jgi:hypothetical protein